jgi:epoxyqueuosine reductase
MDIKSHLMAYARSLGFERAGVTSAEPLLKEEQFLRSWLDEGRSGEMNYLERQPERRSRPAELLPVAKSVIALAMNYYSERMSGRGDERTKESTPSSSAPPLFPSAEGRIARYARGRDYHNVISKRLEAFARYLEALAPQERTKIFVDTGPLLERPLAERAGLGFIGKNTMLITKGLGSWVFLANVITTLELPPDAPDDRSCGECRLCIDACPTEAITEPFVLDARRCLSYLTIEHEGPVDPILRRKTEGWIFGCDICQEVCPHNTAVERARERGSDRAKETTGNFFSRSPAPSLRLAEILSIRHEPEFRSRFAGSPLLRAGRDGLVRSACLAAANLGRQDLLETLRQLAQNDASALVREHAAWAVDELVRRGLVGRPQEAGTQ